MLVQFALRPAVSEMQDCQKSGVHRMTPNWTWTLNSQKYPIYTKDLPSEAPILVRFTPRLAVSEIQGRQKSEVHRMIRNWTWTFSSQKYPIYNTY